MSKPRRSAFVGKVARFDPEDARLFLVDNVKFAFSAPYGCGKELALRPLRVNPSEIRTTSDLGLGGSIAVERPKNGRGAHLKWKSAHGAFEQGLGRGGGLMKATLGGDWNPIRALRRTLTEAERRLHLKVPDNYIDPRIVPRAVAHTQCMGALVDWLRQRQEDYSKITKALWGLDLTPADVVVSINGLELAWDALAPGTASFGARLFRDEWFDAIEAAKHVFDVERLEFGADGCLRGIGGGRELLKLYRKADDLLRFEAQICKSSARRILGKRRRIDPASSWFLEDLREIGAKIYQTILGIQARVVNPSTVSAVEVLHAIARTDRERALLDALVFTGRFKSNGDSDRYLLARYRSLGMVVEGPGKGVWVLSSRYAPGFRSFANNAVREADWRAS